MRRGLIRRGVIRSGETFTCRDVAAAVRMVLTGTLTGLTLGGTGRTGGTLVVGTRTWGTDVTGIRTLACTGLDACRARLEGSWTGVPPIGFASGGVGFVRENLY